MSTPTYPTTHIHAKITGSDDAQSFFHHIIKDIDKDWPLAPASDAAECIVCGGLEWKCPVISVSELYRLAAQINSYARIQGGLRFKLKHMTREADCAEKYTAAVAAGRVDV